MKCEDCQESYCEGKFENRDECLGTDFEGFACNCSCQVSSEKLYLSYALSIGIGGALITTGVLFVPKNESIVAKISRAALNVAGLKLIITPLQKYSANEHLTLKYSLTEAAVGAITGTYQRINYFFKKYFLIF